MSNTKDSAVEVIQSDRHAAADYLFPSTGWNDAAVKTWHQVQNGKDDGHRLVQAFARHRLASMPAATEGESADLLTRAIGDITAGLMLAGKEGLIADWIAPYVEAVNRLDATPATTDQDKLIAEAKKDAFTHGYLIAVSNLAGAHGEDVLAEYLIDEHGGVTLDDLARLGMSEYDVANLTPLLTRARAQGGDA